MLKLIEDIHPLTDFKRNTKKFLKQLRNTGRPIVLTIDGRAALFIQAIQNIEQEFGVDPDFSAESRAANELKTSFELIQQGIEITYLSFKRHYPTENNKQLTKRLNEWLLEDGRSWSSPNFKKIAWKH